MSVESFLLFWDRHNTVIIEVLIGAVLLITVYIAYRAFFGEEEATSAGGAANAGLDVGALEKTLQKLLENQQAGGASAAPAGEGGAGATASASNAELEKLKAELAAKEKALAELKNKPAAAEGGGEEKKKLEDRVKDLEARLAEYEIISEDIADLSFYKEENGKLQKELDGLRGKGGGGSAPAGDAPPASESAPPAATPASAAPAATPEAAAATDVPAADFGAAGSEPIPPPAGPAPEGDLASAIAEGNDDVLKQMAAAATSTPAAANPDDSKLMNQFEDFVKKG